MVKVHPPRSSIPEFHSYDEEAEFWDTHSTEEFADEWEPVDWEIGEVRSHFVVEVELDRPTWERLRAFARARGVPLADLARAWLLEGHARAAAGGGRPPPAPAG